VDAAGPLGSEPDWLFEGTVPAAEPAGGRKRGPGGGGGEAEDGQQKPLKGKPGATRI